MAGDTPVYRPWSIFPWWYHYDAYAPHIFDKAGMLAGASGFLGCASAIAGSLWRARQTRNVTTYGPSRWAKRWEIARVGLFRNAGVFLGRHGRAYLRHDGPEPVMASETGRQSLRDNRWQGVSDSLVAGTFKQK